MANTIKLTRTNTSATAANIKILVEDSASGRSYVLNCSLMAHPHQRDDKFVLLSEHTNPSNEDCFHLDWTEVDYANSYPIFAAADYANRNAFLKYLANNYLARP